MTAFAEGVLPASTALNLLIAIEGIRLTARSSPPSVFPSSRCVSGPGVGQQPIDCIRRNRAFQNATPNCSVEGQADECVATDAGVEGIAGFEANGCRVADGFAKQSTAVLILSTERPWRIFTRVRAHAIEIICGQSFAHFASRASRVHHVTARNTDVFKAECRYAFTAFITGVTLGDAA